MPKPEFETKWESDTYDDAKVAMGRLLNLANSMGSSKAVVAGMLDSFVQEHRTLQQAGVRNFVSFLREWATGEEAAMTDPRNCDAWRFAKQVVDLDPMFANI